MLEYKVTVEQNFKSKGYPERIVADFFTYEQALAFIGTILENCDNVKCIIERIGEDEE